MNHVTSAHRQRQHNACAPRSCFCSTQPKRCCVTHVVWSLISSVNSWRANKANGPLPVARVMMSTTVLLLVDCSVDGMG